MKKFILFIGLSLMASSLMAQSNIYFLLNHKLGASLYSPSATASNNLGDQFKIQRLDYYISEITLYHDGGQSTDVADHYILVKAGREFDLKLDSLGSFNITQLDSVRFGIGVDGARNHSDISAYPSDHPLSFQSPSMHWGWTAGYRFVAIEGSTGPSMNLGWQIHGLGDNNYGYVTVVTNGVWNGNNLTVAIDADYEKALKDISVTGSLNYHGSSSHAVSLLNNFKNEVFTAGSGSVGLEETLDFHVHIYPNPSSGQFQIVFPSDPAGITIEVFNSEGKSVFYSHEVNEASVQLKLDAPGLYWVRVYNENQELALKQVIIK